jgi:hypothetical protein
MTAILKVNPCLRIIIFVFKRESPLIKYFCFVSFKISAKFNIFSLFFVF